MHDLEKLIAEWRASMLKAARKENVEELESHLRESAERFQQKGMSPRESFHAAVLELGSGKEISAEFAKVEGATWWAVKAARITVMATAALAGIFAANFILRSNASLQPWLLGIHVFTIILGYVATYITGALGICYVLQRCFAEFNPGQLRAMARTTSTFAFAAAVATAPGIVLGMLWAKGALGSYWSWDPKETGGFCVLVWLGLFSVVGRFGILPARAVMLLAIVGNLVVSLAWFAPTNAPDDILRGLAISHAAAFLIGFAPSGCLRRFLRSDRSHN